MLHRTDRPCPRSLAGAALAAVLLASACAGAPPATEVTDASGDVQDSYDHTRVEAPDYVDVRHLSAMVDGSQLVLTLDLAGDLPNALDPSKTTVVIGFVFDMKGGDTVEYVAKLRSQDQWRPTLSSLVPLMLGSTADFPGSAEIAGSRVTLRLDRMAIGDPNSLRLKAAVAYEDYPDPDPLIGVSAIDGVPEVAELGLEVRLD